MNSLAQFHFPDSVRVLFGIFFSAGLLFALGQWQVAHAASIVVNTLNDETTYNEGICSLREAIENANTNVNTFPECTKGSGPDTITFSVTGTINLGSTLPAITDNLTITGPGESALIINGAGAPRVFASSATSVTISGLTVQGAASGSGIRIDGGTLTLNQVTISNNTATAPSSTVYGGGVNVWIGNLVMTQVTVTGNHATGVGSGVGYGGGVFVNSGATAIISHSLFSGNSATKGTTAISTAGGGATANSGDLTVTDTTFSSNTTSNFGGAISNSSQAALTNVTFESNQSNQSGGAIVNNGSSARMTLTNATLYGNTATTSPSTVQNSFGSAIVVVNSTIADNPGNTAIGGNATVSLKNTIVSHNTGGNCSASLVLLDGGGNLNWQDSGLGCPGTADDPKLGPLANNGGSVQTRALLAGSAAIDAGNTTTCAAAVGAATYGAGGLDARGMSRSGATCDIGAYERGAPASLVIMGGDTQSATINSTFPTPLAVKVSDSMGVLLDGENVAFSSPASGAGIASGGTVPSGTDGIANLAVTANGQAGPYNVTASVTGPVTVNFALTNLPASTTTTVHSSCNPCTAEQPVMFTANVTSAAGTPTGTVNFKNASTLLGTGTLNGSGQATFTTAALAVGTHTMTAEYAGDGNYLTSSGTVTQVVNEVINSVDLFLPFLRR